MSLRAPTSLETFFVERIAAALPEAERAAVLADLRASRARDGNDIGTITQFVIDGYDRPYCGGQGAYPFEGRIRDEDGVEIQIIMYSDKNDRLLEVEFVKVDGTDVAGPDVSTFKVVPAANSGTFPV